MTTKIMALFLPQFHETEYNNEWWGDGFTDWVTARNAKSFFKGQGLPVKPLDDNYYDLSDKSAKTLEWQAKIARDAGIYGFTIYHYWFPDRQLLDKPVKILYEHPEIDIHYNFCWDASSWKRSWVLNKNEAEILVRQDFGNSDTWKKHYYDMRKYFLDERYIKVDNKPVFQIYKSQVVDCLFEMKECWNSLAKEDGFNGIYLIVGDGDIREKLSKDSTIDAFYNYEPQYTFSHEYKSAYNFFHMISGAVKKSINRLFKTSLFPDKRSAKHIYKCIAKNYPEYDKKTYLGTFSRYDDSPRRQIKGVSYVGNKLEYFKDNLKIQLEKSEKLKNEFMFITAWNEWGETAYLEPDSENGYNYLNAVKDAVMEIDKHY